MNTKAIVYSVALFVVQSLSAADQVSVILPEAAKYHPLKALVPKSRVLKHTILIREAVELPPDKHWLQRVELPAEWQDYKVVVSMADGTFPGHLVLETSPTVIEDQKYLIARIPTLFGCKITISGIPNEWLGEYHEVGWYESTEGLVSTLGTSLDLRANARAGEKSAVFQASVELGKSYTIEIPIAHTVYQWKNVPIGVKEVATGITLDVGAATVLKQEARWSLFNMVLPDGSLDIPKK